MTKIAENTQYKESTTIPVPKVEVPKMEAPKVEAPKVEVPKPNPVVKHRESTTIPVAPTNTAPVAPESPVLRSSTLSGTNTNNGDRKAYNANFLDYFSEPIKEFMSRKPAPDSKPYYSTVSGEWQNVGQGTQTRANLAPQGEIWDNFGKRAVNKGQCGALINDIYTDVHVGDTIKSKLAATNPNINARNVQKDNFIVMSGGKYGHIASVEETRVVNGKKMLRLFEANAKGDFRTTHDRWIPADDTRILGYGSGTLRPEFSFDLEQTARMIYEFLKNNRK